MLSRCGESRFPRDPCPESIRLSCGKTLDTFPGFVGPGNMGFCVPRNGGANILRNDWGTRRRVKKSSAGNGTILKPCPRVVACLCPRAGSPRAHQHAHGPASATQAAAVLQKRSSAAMGTGNRGRSLAVFGYGRYGSAAAAGSAPPSIVRNGAALWAQAPALDARAAACSNAAAA